MKKYRLLKDHPYAKAGTIVEEDARKNFLTPTLALLIKDGMLGNERRDISLSIPFSVEKEWLEPVETRWMPSSGDAYWHLHSALGALSGTYRNSGLDISHSSSGNCFRTYDQAEEAAKRVKACLEAYHEEIGE